jgi:hypothetical protein
VGASLLAKNFKSFASKLASTERKLSNELVYDDRSGISVRRSYLPD